MGKLAPQETAGISWNLDSLQLVLVLLLVVLLLVVVVCLGSDITTGSCVWILLHFRCSMIKPVSIRRIETAVASVDCVLFDKHHREHEQRTQVRCNGVRCMACNW